MSLDTLIADTRQAIADDAANAHAVFIAQGTATASATERAARCVRDAGFGLPVTTAMFMCSPPLQMSWYHGPFGH
jgi:hypothetical protein